MPRLINRKLAAAEILELAKEAENVSARTAARTALRSWYASSISLVQTYRSTILAWPTGQRSLPGIPVNDNFELLKDIILKVTKEATNISARTAARTALKCWYASSLAQANRSLPGIQVNDNFKLLKDFPAWRATKNPEDGYIMLMSAISGTRTPVTLRLQYAKMQPYYQGEKISKHEPEYSLTERELLQQLRSHLSLKPHESLRVCPYRPWYHYNTKDLVPASQALVPRDDQCRHLLGTTLFYISPEPASPWGAFPDLLSRVVITVVTSRPRRVRARPWIQRAEWL